MHLSSVDEAYAQHYFWWLGKPDGDKGVYFTSDEVAEFGKEELCKFGVMFGRFRAAYKRHAELEGPQ